MSSAFPFLQHKCCVLERANETVWLPRAIRVSGSVCLDDAAFVNPAVPFTDRVVRDAGTKI